MICNVDIESNYCIVSIIYHSSGHDIGYQMKRKLPIITRKPLKSRMVIWLKQ